MNFIPTEKNYPSFTHWFLWLQNRTAFHLYRYICFLALLWSFVYLFFPLPNLYTLNTSERSETFMSSIHNCSFYIWAWEHLHACKLPYVIILLFFRWITSIWLISANLWQLIDLYWNWWWKCKNIIVNEMSKVKATDSQLWVVLRRFLVCWRDFYIKLLKRRIDIVQ